MSTCIELDSPNVFRIQRIFESLLPQRRGSTGEIRGVALPSYFEDDEDTAFLRQLSGDLYPELQKILPQDRDARIPHNDVIKDAVSQYQRGVNMLHAEV